MNDNGGNEKKIILKEMKALLHLIHQVDGKLLMLNDADTEQFRMDVDEFQHKALQYTYRLL
jgi:hypothetical protein